MKSIFTKIMKTQVKAFTLLETLASTAIIAMVILGPLSLAVNSASYVRQTKDIMNSTYLAEESLELLHHQYDSLYIACVRGVSPCTLVQFPIVGSETNPERAWRLFKSRLNAEVEGITYGTSCFGEDGCTYDFMDMSTSTAVVPNTYSALDGTVDCSRLALVSSAVSGSVRKRYVCSGITNNQGDLSPLDHKFNVENTAYSRKVFVESVTTFEAPVNPTPNNGTPNLDLYNDDLKITSKVSFRRSNGVMRTITVIDFLHSRQ